jgi:hypothetical protein
MIEGVKIDISTDELKDHLSERASYHQEKQAFYEGQVESLKAGHVGEMDKGAISNDPVSQLEGSARRHKETAALFQFISDHLVPNEVYRLEERDLTRLEVLSRYF